MSLWLDKEEIYVVPYITSKRYLDNLTDLMRTQIRGMKWDISILVYGMFLLHGQLR